MPFPFPGSIAPGRCIVFLICLSLIVVLSTSPSKPGIEPLVYYDAQLIPRQNSVSPSGPVSPNVTPTPSTTTTTSETIPSTTSSPTSEKPTSTTSTPPETSSVPKQETPTTTQQHNTQQTPPPAQLSSIQSTGSDGSPTVIIVTVSASNSNTSPTATPTKDPDSDNSSGSGLGTGSIIGLSVAGGIALLGIAAFFIWKFTRKHRSNTYDDGEIKWPDLNSESHVPGQDDHTTLQAPSDAGSIRDQSFRGAYADGGLGGSQSQVDLHAADPYAVPPLPHLNPNQPYRDDPGAGPYHDNFSVPAFHESRPSSPSIRGEAIPMNQISRARSPGYGGRQSPGPQDAYGGGYGRQSPGPQDAYGGGYGRQSPGPQDAYGAGYGRRSPGPNDAYGPR